MSQDLEQQRTANVVLTADVDQYRQSVQAAGGDTVKLTSTVDQLTRSLDNLAKSAGKKILLFSAGQAASITASTVAFASFEKQMTSLRVNAAVTGRSYDQMVGQVDKLRTTYGVTTAAAAELQRVVLSFKDGAAPVQTLTNTFEKLGAAVGQAPDQLAQGMLQLQRSLGTSQRDTDRYANVLTSLSVRSGVAASSILDFSQAIAPIGRIAGMSQAAIMGVATAFNKSGQDGYLAANAFNKMLSDIMNSVQSGSPDLAKYANLIGVTADQFKKMDKTTAITDVFDQLNRLGPNAIQILNRMGLDGMRMQKAIAGVSQQSGGIGTAIAQAVTAYNDGGQSALNKGSGAAIDTVSEKMNVLSESTKQFGEAMGSSVAGPAKFFLGTLSELAKVATSLANSPLGQLAGWITALASPLVIGTGLLLKFGSTLAKVATGRVLTSNSMWTGVSDQWKATQGRTNFSAMRDKVNYIDPVTGQNVSQAGPVGTGLYRFGERLGQIIPPAPGGRGYINRALGVVPWAGAQLADYGRSAFSPLLHPFDPSARARLFASAFESQQGRAIGSFGLNALTGLPGVLGSNPATQWLAQRRFNGFSPSMWDGSSPNAGVVPRGLIGKSTYYGAMSGRVVGNAFGEFMLPGVMGREAPGPLAGLGPNMGNLMGRGLGLMGAAGGAAAGLGAVGLRTAGSLGISAFNGVAGFLAANPMMALTMGLPLAMMAKQNISAANSVNTNPDALSFLDAYKVAVGDATSATTNFATALRDAAKATTPKSKHAALSVSQSDKDQVAMPGYKYADPRIADITRYQAQYLLQGAMQNASPADLQAMKLDLIKRFGAKDAQSILTDAQKNAGTGFDTGRYMNQIADQSGYWGIKTDPKTKNEYELLGKQFDSMVGTAVGKGGSNAGGAMKNALVNQFVSSFGRLSNDHGRMNDAEQSQAEDFINKHLFGGNIDIGNAGTGTGAVTNKLNPWNQYDINTGPMLDAFKKGRIPGLENFYQQLLNIKPGQKSYDAVNTYLNDTGFSRKSIQSQINAGRGGIFRMDYGRVNALEAQNVTAGESFQDRINATDAGKLFKNDKIIATAVAQPGDQNAQIQGVNEMISKLQKAGDSYAQIDEALLKFQGAIGDTTDPLYKLAEAARQFAAQDLQYKLPYMSGADQFHVAAQGYVAQVAALTPGQGQALPPDAAAQLKKAKDDFEGYKLNLYSNLKQMYVQQRDFNTQMSRSTHDFYDVQLPRMAYSYNLSRTRAEQDYNRSRYRAQLQFNISQKDTLTDFNISRKRSEQDFYHQRDLMVKQAAQSEMNAYQRVFVQQTWSGQGLAGNLEDQNYRLDKQTKDLAQVKKMGLTKDAIQQLGFTDPGNAQQLTRFIEDAMSDPNMVKRVNKDIADRLATTKKLVTDSSNAQWAEMSRQYKQNMQRGEEDLNRGLARQTRNFNLQMTQGEKDYQRTMNRGEQDYNTSLSNMVTDFKTQQNRAMADLETSQHDITMSFQQMLVKASQSFHGWMKGQVDQMIKDYRLASQEIAAITAEIVANTNKNWQKMPGYTALSNPGSRHGVNFDGGVGAPGGGGTLSAAGSSPHPQNEALVKKMAAARGWTGREWDALYHLIMGESGFNNTAKNPNSTAYGMFQFLDTTWKGYGVAKTSDPAGQTRAGLNYIASRYTNPLSAWNFWQRTDPRPNPGHWYGDGSVFTGPKIIGVGERGPEAVLPLNERGADFVANVLRRYSSEIRGTWVSGNPIPVGGNTYNYRIDKSTNFTGPVQVSGVENPRQLAEKARLEARRKRLTSGKAR